MYITTSGVDTYFVPLSPAKQGRNAATCLSISPARLTQSLSYQSVGATLYTRHHADPWENHLRQPSPQITQCRRLQAAKKIEAMRPVLMTTQYPATIKKLNLQAYRSALKATRTLQLRSHLYLTIRKNIYLGGIFYLRCHHGI